MFHRQNDIIILSIRVCSHRASALTLLNPSRSHLNFYQLQTKFVKVMFLHLSVILFTGGVKPRPRGVWPGVCPGPHGGVSRPTPEGRLGVPRPTPGGVQAPAHGGCIPACTEADNPADGYCCGRYASYWNAYL